jgi:hypothetical protein
MEKWKVPSCPRCNSEYGRLEERLLHRLGMSALGEVAGSEGIRDRAMRAIQPELGMDDRDRRCRDGLRQKIHGEVRPLSKLTNSRFLIGFGPEQPSLIGSCGSIEISETDFVRFSTKLVRGFTWYMNSDESEDKRFISPEYEIRVFLDEPIQMAAFVVLTSTYGQVYHVGPGLRITRRVTPDDPLAARFII